MNSTLKLILSFLCGAVGGGIPVALFYLLWTWCCMMIGSTIPYAGLIKVVLTLFLLATGGTVTVICALVGAALATSIAIAILEP